MAKRLQGPERDKAFNKLTKLVKADPLMTFSQLPLSCKEITISSFSRWKAQILTGNGKKAKSGSKNSVNYEPIDKFIKEHPMSSWAEFKKKYPKVSVSDACFYARRRKITGKGSSRSKHVAYFKVCSFELDEYNDKSKELLKKFLSILREKGRARFEAVELADPKQLEVREETKL